MAASETSSPREHVPAELALDCATTADLLEDFVRRETRKAGFRRVVVGLSGGIDSSTSAAIASRALGPGGVLGALLPYRTSSAASRRDALHVADLLGIRAVTIDISPMVDGYFRRQRGASRTRRGNMMARQR